MLLQVTAPYFCAGVEIKNDKVTTCAPILKYMSGWSEFEVKRYCNNKHWDVEVVNQ